MNEKIKEILSEFTNIPTEEMNDDTLLVNDLGLNSLDVVNVVVAFEDEFNIEIPDRVIPRFQTIDDIQMYIKSATRLES